MSRDQLLAKLLLMGFTKDKGMEDLGQEAWFTITQEGNGLCIYMKAGWQVQCRGNLYAGDIHDYDKCLKTVEGFL